MRLIFFRALQQDINLAEDAPYRYFYSTVYFSECHLHRLRSYYSICLSTYCSVWGLIWSLFYVLQQYIWL